MRPLECSDRSPLLEALPFEHRYVSRVPMRWSNKLSPPEPIRVIIARSQSRNVTQRPTSSRNVTQRPASPRNVPNAHAQPR